MDPINFTFTVILISVSGALAPGPLFFLTLSQGVKTGAKTGFLFSIAHTLVEFTLVMLLAIGLLSVANEPLVRLFIGLAGGIFLLIFGVIQLINSLSSKSSEEKMKQKGTKNLLFIGLIFTGLNPYFIIWWFTIGANLILLAIEFASITGVILMYISHVWIDYAWLVFISSFAKKGARILKFKWYRVLMVIFAVILIYFGLTFIFDSLIY